MNTEIYLKAMQLYDIIADELLLEMFQYGPTPELKRQYDFCDACFDWYCVKVNKTIDFLDALEV